MDVSKKELRELDADLRRLSPDTAGGADDGNDAEIDPGKYRKRRRFIYALFLGAGLAGATTLVLEMVDQRRNPCQRLTDFLCQRDPAGLDCITYRGVLEESEQDESPKMRSTIRAQCQTKIDRLAEEDGLRVP